jgi:hypothetical protein
MKSNLVDFNYIVRSKNNWPPVSLPPPHRPAILVPRRLDGPTNVSRWIAGGPMKSLSMCGFTISSLSIFRRRLVTTDCSRIRD